MQHEAYSTTHGLAFEVETVHEPRDVGSFYELKKARRWILSQSS